MIISHRLIQSEIIPPAPDSAVDYLPDLAGESWIAYGASNLLVISHLPTRSQTLTGPLFRQVIEVSRGVVSSVSWGPEGSIAAVSRNCIALFSHCSFSWRQTAVLVQSTDIETITWTGSGDGIISCGLEVILWRLKIKSWEIAWKFKPELPQNIVAATFSIQGPFATTSTLYTKESRSSVFLCYGDGDFNHVESELQHPMPVCMIQWKPLKKRQPSQDYSQSGNRQVLLTCCLDGTVRLWCEINDAKVKRTHDQKNTRRDFNVVATIEINQTLKGTLGSDVFVKWATEVDDMNISGSYDPPVICNRAEKTGNCEWLVVVGPNMVVSFWAIHCLDDVSPMRFPRVTKWLRRELEDTKSGGQGLLLNNVRISRNALFDPPNFCSLVQLLPCKSIVWSQLYTPTSANDEEETSHKIGKEKYLSGYNGGILNFDGHKGKILNVAVHRYRFDIDLAASLDSDGSVFLWSFPINSNSLVGMPTFYPTRKHSGNILSGISHPIYTSMVWAPCFSDEDSILFMGHDEGVDCILIKILRNEEKNILCYKLCTIAYPSHSSRSANIYAIPLPSNCKESISFNSFLLLSIWDQDFQALSWKISIHSTLSDTKFRDCKHDSDMAFESDFVGMRYHIAIDSWSSLIPDLHNGDKFTSSSIISPNIFVLTRKINWDSSNELCGHTRYHMITGHDNGNVKLWRSSFNSSSHWELVGMLATNHGPIKSIALTGCGRKISTLNTPNTVQIWESVSIGGTGSFILGCTLVFDKEVVAINWLTLGNGQLILGVCLVNELRVYAKKQSDWFCISIAKTYSAIHCFVWGPRAMAVILYDRYFSLFSQWSFLAGDETPSKGSSVVTEESFIYYEDGPNGSMQSEIFVGNGNVGSDGLSEGYDGQESQISINLNSTNDSLSHILLARDLQKRDSRTETAVYSLQEIVERLNENLASYHPKALLTNIYSGHWKRAYVSLQHLVEYTNSSSFSPIENCHGKSVPVIPLVHLSSYVEGVLSTQRNGSGDSGSLTTLNQFAFSWGPEASSKTPTSSDFKLSSCISVVEMLHDKEAINNTEKMEILTIIDLLNEIHNPTSVYESLDESGRRFWVAVRYQQLIFFRKYGSSASARDMVFGSDMFAWAFHSDCQENLFTSLLPTEPSWEDIRNCGAGFWYTNTTQLRIKMEKLARQQYLKSRDPKACALLYIALNRLHVLAGLFKISKDEKDKPLVGFLSRNFKEDKNKAAALKNAYVLMGRHQLDLAAAFFLLGGDTSSAVTVCAKNLGDEQLGLVICRLIEEYSGNLERQLISKHLLPSAIEKGDTWMASLLEWLLGNYTKSFLSMLGMEMHTPGKSPVPPLSNHTYLLDPSIGQYCLMLATKNTMKNAAGEYSAAIMGRWANWIFATSLDRRGLPVEALECLSSSLRIFSSSDQEKKSVGENSEVLKDLLLPFLNNSSNNWISDDVAFCMETHSKVGLAMKYISTLLREHPSWPPRDPEPESDKYYLRLSDFQAKLKAGTSCLEQKFNLPPFHLYNMIACVLSNKGLLFIGYQIFYDYASQTSLLGKEASSDSSVLNSINSKLLSRATEEVSCSIPRFIIACNMIGSQPKPSLNNYNVWRFYVMGFKWSIWRLKTTIKLLSGSHTEEVTRISYAGLNLSEYCIYFGLAWIQRDLRSLIIIMKAIINTYTNRQANDETNALDLKKLLQSIEKLLAENTLANDTGNFDHDQAGILIPAVLREKIIWTASWRHLSCFLKQQLTYLSGELEDNYSCGPFDNLLLSSYSNDKDKQLSLLPVVLTKLLRTLCSHISSYCMKQFASFLIQSIDDEFNFRTLAWLEGSGETPSTEDDTSTCEMLWDLLSDPKFIRDGLFEENIEWKQYIQSKPFKEWEEVHMNLAEERETGSPVRESSSPDGHSIVSFGQAKQMHSENFIAFHNPKEVCRVDGELIEAMCVNSVDQKQVALASNRKGIVYFNWDNDLPQGDYSNYIWEEAIWPRKGWAGSVSTPVPTCVSPCISLGRRENGKHPVGSNSLSRPVKELTGGGAFGIPGYAGIGASGLGWEIQEDIEEFVDPPATANNIRTRAVSSHPSRPFFLAGSNNTHTYLWEFGKDKATATYGVLPAANVPPPYAIASISAVQFDKCGQRFATAALDGSLSTWQLEVGGRSNVLPTESSLCFNNHASDVTYVTASGSIIAAAGHSSSGINVVIWDTLAPPNTSRASIMCHGGGALSLSVFDNDIGSGSISPFIVTGGKGGDVGLHDFRYIATGKTKKHKLFMNSGESDGNASFTADVDSRNGDRNRDGMLWYIPKAHSGSVTKICTIPNSSLFLTGSKDGDVKLWDAKTAKLVSHWPKLHEKHTFLQPSSRGFGGIVRAAVTDIQVISSGFLSCGGDGSVKLVQLKGSV